MQPYIARGIPQVYLYALRVCLVSLARTTSISIAHMVDWIHDCTGPGAALLATKIARPYTI